MFKVYIGYVTQGNNEFDFIAKLTTDENLDNYIAKTYGKNCKYRFSEIDEEQAEELNII